MTKKTLKILRNISVFLVIGFSVNIASQILGSEFLIKYLEDNIITILVALLAINITTISVILAKLEDLTKGKDFQFDKSSASMKNSVTEQVILIGVSTALLILKSSPPVINLSEYILFGLDTLLIAVAINAVQVLKDTARASFKVLGHRSEPQETSEA